MCSWRPTSRWYALERKGFANGGMLQSAMRVGFVRLVLGRRPPHELADGGSQQTHHADRAAFP